MPAANGRRGLVATGMAMIRSEGRFSPYRGVWTMVAGAGPAHALYFASYERLKVILSPAGSANSNPLAQSAAACVATVLHDGVMTPAEGPPSLHSTNDQLNR